MGSPFSKLMGSSPTANTASSNTGTMPTSEENSTNHEYASGGSDVAAIVEEPSSEPNSTTGDNAISSNIAAATAEPLEEPDNGSTGETGLLDTETTPEPAQTSTTARRMTSRRKDKGSDKEHKSAQQGGGKDKDVLKRTSGSSRVEKPKWKPRKPRRKTLLVKRKTGAKNSMASKDNEPSRRSPAPVEQGQEAAAPTPTTQPVTSGMEAAPSTPTQTATTDTVPSPASESTVYSPIESPSDQANTAAYKPNTDFGTFLARINGDGPPRMDPTNSFLANDLDEGYNFAHPALADANTSSLPGMQPYIKGDGWSDVERHWKKQLAEQVGESRSVREWDEKEVGDEDWGFFDDKSSLEFDDDGMSPAEDEAEGGGENSEENSDIEITGCD
ncbi:uncharacterized protein K452DRAFT_321532 [Aplosporella prunicola CBS 121167]|uniref:Uncharacterized protein n=1 Tax=Aplosporella prunicola CBS 121167 TaxID=1176127 RepID=A0A6A6B3A0_9PEZI|nr:uncharacterized protein K452DRAFT_321532 [Aplosporella prunicola CBS 121167]KAF2137853.1 hypothetical protein K452DRAFT_321532 [Aplosporella prunicola CBS 121167]